MGTRGSEETGHGRGRDRRAESASTIGVRRSWKADDLQPALVDGPDAPREVVPVDVGAPQVGRRYVGPGADSQNRPALFDGGDHETVGSPPSTRAPSRGGRRTGAGLCAPRRRRPGRGTPPTRPRRGALHSAYRAQGHADALPSFALGPRRRGPSVLLRPGIVTAGTVQIYERPLTRAVRARSYLKGESEQTGPAPGR